MNMERYFRASASNVYGFIFALAFAVTYVVHGHLVWLVLALAFAVVSSWSGGTVIAMYREYKEREK